MSQNTTIVNILLVIIIGYMAYCYFSEEDISTDANVSADTELELENIPESINLDKEELLDSQLEDIFKNDALPLAQVSYSQSLQEFEHNTSLPRVYMNLKVGNQELGQVVIKLYTNIVPKTCENFRTLCTGERGYTRSGKLLSYKGSRFHRIIPGFMCQGGDIQNGDGTGKMSIYGNQFEDENFILHHDKPGIVSMANSGPDTNGCQFFIITQPASHLDGKHVVFGQVIHGMELIKKIEKLGSADGTPKANVIVQECGQIQ